MLKITNWISILLISMMLSGCVGGPIAQQIVQAVVLRAADKVVANAVEANERKQQIAEQNKPISAAAGEHYDLAIANSGFKEITAVVEPLPAEAVKEDAPYEYLRQSVLVKVDVVKVLTPTESRRMIEVERTRGSKFIPDRNDTDPWLVAIGRAENNKNLQSPSLAFLIPPDLDPIKSGDQAMIELSGIRGLNIARHTLN